MVADLSHRFIACFMEESEKAISRGEKAIIHHTRQTGRQVHVDTSRQVHADDRDFDMKSMLQDIQKKLNENQAMMNHVVDRVDKLSSLVNDIKVEQDQLWSENERLSSENERLKDRVYRNEAQSRRNNLLFFGIEDEKGESWETSEEKVRNFMVNTLKLDGGDHFNLERVHRLNTKRSPRPIIAQFSFYKDKEVVKRKARDTLKEDKTYRMSDDFTKEVREKRAKLRQYLQQFRSKGEDCYISYDKLIAGDNIYIYDWGKDKLISVGKRLHRTTDRRQENTTLADDSEEEEETASAPQ